MASTGGPEVAWSLGWDRREGEVFFAGDRIDESGFAPAIVYFNLKDKLPAAPRQVVWSKGADRGDSGYDAKLSTLKQTLRPLQEEVRPTVFHYFQIVSRDTLKPSELPRYRVI